MCCSFPAVYGVHPVVRDDDETEFAMCEIHLGTAIAKAVEITPLKTTAFDLEPVARLANSVTVEVMLWNTDECDFCECD